MKNDTMHIKAVLFHFESTLAQLDNQNAGVILDTEPGFSTETLAKYLHTKKLRLAIFSRKNLRYVHRIFENLPSHSVSEFDLILSREELQTYPPDINPVRVAAEKLNLPAEQILIVAADPALIRDGRKAGAVTVLYDPSVSSRMFPVESTFRISQFSELKSIVRMGIPLLSGKLPNDLLREFLNEFVFDDPSILINPGVGEDIAAVNVESEEVLVLKSDPITFATDSIGQYAVLINANDIATSGAKPRWLLTTLLFPCGITPYEIQKVINELKEFCRQWDITLCGGHTEITDAVTRPVVTGMMAGTVARHNLIDKSNMAPGNRILLTKGVAVEGTAIIAREFGNRLQDLGMAGSDINKCRRFLTDISVIKEARIAAEYKATNAMHDVTEGGLATALEELSTAGGHKIKIEMDIIPIFRQTRKICRLLDIDPLGLIGSGSLLICCRESGCKTLMAAIQKAGIQVTCIGEVLEKGQGIDAVKENQTASWPQFEVDEITQLF